MTARNVTRPQAAPAAPAAGRPLRSITPASSSPPRSARNWRSPSPPTGTPAACGSRVRRSRSCSRPAPSGPSGSGTRGHRPPDRSWRASSKPSTGPSATRSTRNTSAPGRDGWRESGWGPSPLARGAVLGRPVRSASVPDTGTRPPAPAGGRGRPALQACTARTKPATASGRLQDGHGGKHTWAGSGGVQRQDGDRLPGLHGLPGDRYRVCHRPVNVRPSPSRAPR